MVLAVNLIYDLGHYDGCCWCPAKIPCISRCAHPHWECWLPVVHSCCPPENHPQLKGIALFRRLPQGLSTTDDLTLVWGVSVQKAGLPALWFRSVGAPELPMGPAEATPCSVLSLPHGRPSGPFLQSTTPRKTLLQHLLLGSTI